MLKNDLCITVIGQAVLQIFHFTVDITYEKKSQNYNFSLCQHKKWRTVGFIMSLVILQ